jgi:tripartite-type tricarboxylate transporter receptor subunit TctC
MRGMRIAVASAAALMLGHAQSWSQSPAEFYRGKTIYLMIGEASGGDYDSWGRLVARHIKDHIPGAPNVVPQNVVGAGGLSLANQIYNVVPKDGTVLGTFNRGLPFLPLLGDSAARFDASQMNWIGSTERDVYVCWDHPRVPIVSLDELLSKQLILGATGSGSDTLTIPYFLANLLGLKLKVISGFAGTAEVELAVERGEVDGLCSSYSAISRHAIFRAGNVRLLFQLAPEPDPRIKEVPMVSDLAGSEPDRQAMQFYLARLLLGRPFVAPPGVPPERVAALRQAFDDTMRDEAFVAEVRQAHMTLLPSSGQALADAVRAVYQTPVPVIERTARAMLVVPEDRK